MLHSDINDIQIICCDESVLRDGDEESRTESTDAIRNLNRSCTSKDYAVIVRNIDVEMKLKG